MHKVCSGRARQETIHPLSMRTRLQAVQCLYLAFHIAAFCPRTAFGAPGQSSAEAREHAQRGLTFARLNDLKGAEAEFRRAEAERQEKLKLAEKLRELGYNPEELI